MKKTMARPPEWLPIAVRAYTPPTRPLRDPKKAPRGAGRRPDTPELVLVLDTETTTDATQRLLFGRWRVYQDGRCISEGLFSADDLPTPDRAILADYLRSHSAETDEPQPLLLLTRHQFLTDVFWPVAYKGRGLVVGFNLPFDLVRLSIGWGTARGRLYGGGFSLAVASYVKDRRTLENRYRPRIAVKSLDSKRALLGFTRAREPDVVDQIPEGSPDGGPDPHYAFRGHFLDLRTLAFALTNQSHSLASACAAYRVAHGKGIAGQHGIITPEYVDYNRRDVLATWELFEQLHTEYGRHPIALPLWQAYSPASVGKAYLRAMGIRPVLARQPDFPKDVLGYAMAAYYGGRAECRIRGVPMPVVYLDFLSMYPTVCSLMGLWRLLIAKRVAVEDATADVKALLAKVTLEQAFDPALWSRLIGLVQLVPDGDILPTRAAYGGSSAWQIGVNPYTTSEPQWYTIADAMASTLLTSKPPRVLKALRLVPHWVVSTLRPVKLRGEVPVDPRTQDFFRVAIQERHRLEHRSDLTAQERKWPSAFLKVVANAAGYGIYAEMNPQELPKGERQTVEVSGNWEQAFSTSVHTPEVPGAYCFPPFAACIAGAARLMLALLERCVTDAGGTYAMCDTDSMAVVATETGGVIACPGGPVRLPDGQEAVQALSWAQVEGIRARFTALNPYDRDAVPGSVLKLEPENRDSVAGERRQLWGYSISAKRYALYNVDEDGRPLLPLRKYSEHGLGHLLNPTDPPDTEDIAEEDVERKSWMSLLWEGIVTEETGHLYTWSDWLERPALGRITATSPQALHPFATLNQGKSYAQQVKPYNFLLTTYVKRFGHPDGVNPTRFHLVAPFESDARKWAKLPWANLYDEQGKRYRVTSKRSEYMVSDVAQVKTYGDVLAEYRRHPETKSLAPDGTPCTRSTAGLLRRRPVAALYVTHVGKESNRLEEVEAGLVHDPEEVYTEYPDPAHDAWSTLVVPMLKRMSLRRIQEQTGMGRTQIKAVRNGHARPHATHRAALLRAAGAFGRDRVAAAGRPVPRDDLAACAAYLTPSQLDAGGR
jgi:hypothetical protein